MIKRISGQIIGLEEDFGKEVNSIKKEVNYALTQTGVELAHDLQSTLNREWYNKYKPKVYKRRTDDPSLGTPIGSDENFDETYTDPTKQMLYFAYNPTGRHIKPAWSERNGDSLIAWIQNEHNYANKETGEIDFTIPARPFWNIFVREQENGGLMEKFIKAMSPKYTVIEDRDKIDLSDSYLPENEVQVHSH